MSDTAASPVRLDFEGVRDALIQQILDFCAAHGMSKTKFGIMFAGDNKLVSSMRRSSIRLETLMKASRRANAYADALAGRSAAEAVASD